MLVLIIQDFSTHNTAGLIWSDVIDSSTGENTNPETRSWLGNKPWNEGIKNTFTAILHRLDFKIKHVSYIYIVPPVMWHSLPTSKLFTEGASCILVPVGWLIQNIYGIIPKTVDELWVNWVQMSIAVRIMIVSAAPCVWQPVTQREYEPR